MARPKKQEPKPTNLSDWIDQWPGVKELDERHTQSVQTRNDAQRECRYKTYEIQHLMVGVDLLREKVYETEAIWDNESDLQYKDITGDCLECWRDVHQGNADNLHDQAIEKCFEVVKLKKDWDEKKLTSSNLWSELTTLRQKAREAWDKHQKEKK